VRLILTAKWEVGRKGRRGILSHFAVKYCFEIMGMGQEELVKSRYEWQVENLNLESWTVSLKENYTKLVWEICGRLAGQYMT
jgi:hypothetical protein